MRRAIAVLLLAFPALACATGAGGKPAESTASEKVTVYVYRERRFLGSGLEPSVYCDGVQVARMDNGRFFIVLIPSGKHVFRSSDKKHEVSLDFKPGQTYYIRIDLHFGIRRGNARPIFVIPEQAQEELKKNITYIGHDKIIDKDLVLLKPPTLVQ